MDLGEHEFMEIPIVFELNANSLLVKCGVLKSVLLHKSNLKGKGKYTAIKIGSDNYIEQGILENDIIIIKEADKLAFNTKAVVSVGGKTCLGEIIENKQLPVFKKFDQGSAIVINFEIKGQIVSLIRNF